MTKICQKYVKDNIKKIEHAIRIAKQELVQSLEGYTIEDAVEKIARGWKISLQKVGNQKKIYRRKPDSCKLLFATLREPQNEKETQVWLNLVAGRLHYGRMIVLSIVTVSFTNISAHQQTRLPTWWV